MGDLDLERAERLLVSARENLERGHVAGIAGLSYQAIEAAATHLIDIVNGHDPGGHSRRMSRASELLMSCKSELDLLWKARNVDFYGNERVGGPKRCITAAEAWKSLEAAEEIVQQMKELIRAEEAPTS